ncbi:MAG: sugar porter family MFS transporter [Bacteroidia bacterium]|nr:sugar porter family MFS transporter [Bacteroidia bacterium]MBT8270150.1 sugar porter family MFS transporter [Bacteroidia bacterium]NNF82927.1 sugar porter family MFS transporter [Flavobacteriaceae bacterium]NNK68876.1 sugar porter family MFS transporter [Flavobacteriaceae bacterium]NNL80858.1 sugar porter family MFS transporter [Flavobacteriaceae bacterium]
MKNKTVLWSIAVAVAGFLFGFDTVVISGANEPIKELWQTSPWFHGTFIMSMALWGTVIGALTGGIPANRFGRKRTLFWIGLLFLVSALGSALAPDKFSFSFFRFIGGLGVGASSVVAPMYISEISSSQNRGKLVALYQFNIVFGIFVAYFSNLWLQGFDGANDWRWMLGVEAIPAFIYSVLIIAVPSSPRWLIIKKGNDEEALGVLNKIYTAENAQRHLDEIKDEEQSLVKTSTNIFTKAFRFPLTLAFLVAFFNQLSGINFLLYYAPEIFGRAGIEDPFLASVYVGLANLIFTMIGMSMIDRFGRRQLLIIGSIGYIISLSIVSWAFKTDASATILLSFIIVFVASHAIGQGAIIWVFISEIFPNRVRAMGNSWGCGTHWVFAALITLLTPVFLDEQAGLLKDDPWIIFAFFAGMMILQLLFALFMMPETKGVSLEELSKKLVRHEKND